MEINLLGTEELRYELEIRGLPITGTFAEKRATLREAMRFEREGRVDPPLTSRFDTESELFICKAKLFTLSRDINSFDFGNRANEYKRINTHLTHTKLRIHRIKCYETFDHREKQSLVHRCETLINHLHFTFNELPLPSVNAPNVNNQSQNNPPESHPSLLDTDNVAFDPNILPPENVQPPIGDRSQAHIDLISFNDEEVSNHDAAQARQNTIPDPTIPPNANHVEPSIGDLAQPPQISNVRRIIPVPSEVTFTNHSSRRQFQEPNPNLNIRSTSQQAANVATTFRIPHPQSLNSQPPFDLPFRRTSNRLNNQPLINDNHHEAPFSQIPTEYQQHAPRGNPRDCARSHLQMEHNITDQYSWNDQPLNSGRNDMPFRHSSLNGAQANQRVGDRLSSGSHVRFTESIPDRRSIAANANSTYQDQTLSHPDPYVNLAEKLQNFQFSPSCGPQRERSLCHDFVPPAYDISRWNLKYNGQSSVNDFLERVEELRTSRGVSKAQLLRSAPELFTKDALLWYRTGSFSGWDNLVCQLKESFQPFDYEYALWDEIRRRTQGSQERVLSFVVAMENLFRKLPSMPSESTRLQIVQRNLLPYIQSRLAAHPISSFQELVKFSRAIEETEARIRRFAPPPTNYRQLLEPELAYHKPSYQSAAIEIAETPVTETSSPDDLRIRSPFNVDAVSTPLLCWNCNQPGHSFRQCNKPRNIFCYRCGKPDVTSKSCTKCTKNVRQGEQS